MFFKWIAGIVGQAAVFTSVHNYKTIIKTSFKDCSSVLSPREN